MEKMYPIFDAVNKVTYKDKCLWNHCEQKSIKSHSHTKSLLQNISLENKIYGINKNPIYWDKGEFFRKFGVKEASTFYGFCAEHDNNLFKSIEYDELKDIQSNEAFLLFARSIFFEYYQKKTAILRDNKFIELCKEQDSYVNDKSIQSCIQGKQLFIDRDFPAYENTIYQIAANNLYNSEIQFLYKKINKPLDISLSTLINPLFNEFFPDKANEQPFFSLNILPYKNHGLIVISWLKKYDAYMSWIRQEFSCNFNKFINYLCFLESEDFYFSIKLYNLSIKKHLCFFKKAFFNRISHPDYNYSKTKLLYNFD